MRRGCGVSERAKQRLASERERARGSRSFAGDEKRNRGEPRRMERVEIDAKDERASEWRQQAARKAGRERFYLLTPPPRVVHARRDGLMRGRVRGKRNDDSDG